MPTLIPLLLLLALAPAPAAGSGCGNGLVDPTEFCDDGNTIVGDGCSPSCVFEICGDGVVDPVGEECDTGSLCEDGTTDCTVVSTPGSAGGPQGDCTGIGGETCAARGGVGDGCSETCRFECGNGVLDPGEECDDGNRTDCDGCASYCIPEECGNGVLGCGEECDDGNTVDFDFCGSDCILETHCAPVTRSDIRCLTEMRQRFEGVWKAAARVAARCLHELSRGTRTDDLAACLAGDEQGKVARARARTLQGETRHCESAHLPGFGFLGGAHVNDAAADGVGASIGDLFGPAPAADKRAERAVAKCQREVAKWPARLGLRGARSVRKLATGTIQGTKFATGFCSAPELAERSEQALRDDKVVRTAAKAAARIARKCPAGDLSPWFGAGVDASSAGALGPGLAARVLCRLCLAIGTADGLDALMDCDAVDDGAANASCP